MNIIGNADFIKNEDGDSFVIRPLYEGEFPISDDTPMEDYIAAREKGLRFVSLTEDGRVRETWNDWINCDPERVKYASTQVPADLRGEIPEHVWPAGMSGTFNDPANRTPGVVINQRRGTFDYSDDMDWDAFVVAREAKLNPRAR